MSSRPVTVRELCLRVLESGELAPKLAPPGGALADPRAAPIQIDRPARAAGLELAHGAPRLPRPGALHESRQRALALARFAHHELMAVELLAWALLRWPRAPAALRRGWLGVLLDEQRHCSMYLARLAAHGSRLEEHPCSDYFWRHAPSIAASPHGERAFLAALGLTLEQANLDFAPAYAAGLRAAGDEASAEVCERVHADEIGHVRLAARWSRRLAPGRSELDAYTEAVPFPLGAARAKGRRFDADARRAAGLGEELIEHVRHARPEHQLRRA